MQDRVRDQDELAAGLHASIHRLASRLRHVELPFGLTPERLRTLATISANGPVSVTGLAAMERVRPATISRMLASLEADGLVQRRVGMHDKRSVFVSVTGRGRQLTLRANRIYLRRMRSAIARLDSDRARQLEDLPSLLDELSLALDR